MTTGPQFYTSLPIYKTKLQLKIISNQLRIYFVVAYPNSDKNLTYINVLYITLITNHDLYN